jgi:uncharacterized protein (TIGR02246 family)
VNDSHERGSAGARALVERLLAAYDAGDLETYIGLLARDVESVNYGRDLSTVGRDAVREHAADVLAQFPDRRFVETRRWIVASDAVAVELVWQGTCASDIPGFMQAGEVRRLEQCSVFTVEQGLVTSVHEYPGAAETTPAARRRSRAR